MSKYYKVVIECGGELTSYAASGAAEAVYKVGEWTEAPKWLAEMGYHLFVFDSIEKAMEWKPPYDTPIYECEAEGIYPNLPTFLNLESLSEERAEYPEKEATFPDGTVMVERVKLLKEVDQ